MFDFADYEDYEDFFQESNKFEEEIQQLKDTLKHSVAKKWIDRMETLEKENEELREVKENLEEIKKDYDQKKRECDIAIRDAEANARNMRLKELMENVRVTYYKCGVVYKHGPKCNKCDDERWIHYKTPSGNDAKEACACARKITILEPKEMVLHEFELKEGNRKATAWFIEHDLDREDSYYTTTECMNDKTIVDNDADVKTLDCERMYSFYFRTREKCQEYCDWYNENKLGVNENGFGFGLKDLCD